MKNINKKLMLTSFIGGMIVFILLSLNMIVSAAPANPFPQQVKQANGTEITIQGFGDEFFNWVETSDGHIVAYDEKANNWCYAYISEDKILPGNEVVGESTKIFSLERPKITRDNLTELINSGDSSTARREMHLQSDGIMSVQSVSSAQSLLPSIEQKKIGSNF